MGKKQKKKSTARTREALKAQVKTKENTRGIKEKTQEDSANSAVSATSVGKKEKVNPTHALPIKEIKHDLMKTGVFAVFAVTVLFALHTTNTTYSDILKFLKFF